MRNFYYKLVKNVFVICVCSVIVLSYRLVYNEFYFEIHEEIEVGITEEDRVYPLGKIVGLYTKCNGVFVIDTCEIECSDGTIVDIAGDEIKSGDYILSIDGIPLSEKEDMVKSVENSKGEPLEFEIAREDEKFTTLLTPVLAKNGNYMLGIWVKDDLAGVGTITYFTEQGDFAALGHGMGDGETKNLFDVDGGDVYLSHVAGIEKGMRGNPGEIKGIISYGFINHIGKVSTNTGNGIYGMLDQDNLQEYLRTYKSYEAADKQEIKQGPAQILSEVSGELRVYDIMISYVDYLAMDSNKGLHIQVTDPELLALTGGIVQGMSGSPILQNGRIVGAVTHVLVNDPTRGYGIFIENMLEAAK